MNEAVGAGLGWSNAETRLEPRSEVLMTDPRSPIPSDLGGVWLTSTESLLAVNAVSRHAGCTASLPPGELAGILDPNARHLVIPALVNHPSDPSQRCFRCLVSMKLRDQGRRVTSLLDATPDQLLGLRRPSEGELHRIVRALVEAADWVNLSDLNQARVDGR